jgi:hypothetical protein
MGPLGHRPSGLRHNIEACVPSRMTSPLLLMASLIKTRATNPPALESDAHSAAGRRARKTDGFVPAGTSGIRSTLAGCAPLASINGLRRNASPVSSGQHIPSGMGSDSAASRARL